MNIFLTFAPAHGIISEFVADFWRWGAKGVGVLWGRGGGAKKIHHFVQRKKVAPESNCVTELANADRVILQNMKVTLESNSLWLHSASYEDVLKETYCVFAEVGGFAMRLQICARQEFERAIESKILKS